MSNSWVFDIKATKNKLYKYISVYFYIPEVTKYVMGQFWKAYRVKN